MQSQLMPAAPVSQRVEQSHDTLLDALGSSDIHQHLFGSVRAVADVDRIYCFDQRRNSATPTLYCSWSASPVPGELVDRYRMLYHRYDPAREALPDLAPSSCAAITFRADEVRHDDYRRTCFDNVSIRHRLSVVKRVADTWLTLSVARRSHAFSTQEVSELSMLARLSLPVLAQHDRLRCRTPGGNFSLAEIERRLEALGKGLTERERQVSARTILGMSAEGAAIDLGIAQASVLTYRQRSYRRANVSNAMQLATLILH